MTAGRKLTRRATLGLAAAAGLGAVGLSPERFSEGARTDPSSVWPVWEGQPDRRRFAPVDPDVRTGEVAWTAELRGEVDGLRVGSRRVYVLHSPPEGSTGVLALGRETGDRLWRTEPSVAFGTVSAGFSAGTDVGFSVFAGSVYVPAFVSHGDAGTDCVFAFDGESGVRRWVHTGVELDRSSLPVATEGAVLLTDDTGDEQILRGYEHGTGLPTRTIESSRWVGLVAAADDHLFLDRWEADGTEHRQVLSVVSRDGSREWTAPFPAESGGTLGGVQAVTDDRVVLRSRPSGGDDGNRDTATIVALDRTDGSEAWRVTLETGNVVPGVIATDERCFATLIDRLVAIDLADGAVQWDRSIAPDDPNTGLEVVSPTRLYAPRSDGLHLADPATGRPSGDPLLPGRIVDSVAVVDDSIVALENVDGRSRDGRWRLHRVAST